MASRRSVVEWGNWRLWWCSSSSTAVAGEGVAGRLKAASLRWWRICSGAAACDGAVLCGVWCVALPLCWLLRHGGLLRLLAVLGCPGCWLCFCLLLLVACTVAAYGAAHYSYGFDRGNRMGRIGM
jgi:hypothetical protein